RATQRRGRRAGGRCLRPRASRHRPGRGADREAAAPARHQGLTRRRSGSGRSEGGLESGAAVPPTVSPQTVSPHNRVNEHRGPARSPMTDPVTVDAQARTRLSELVAELAVVHGRVTLASGREADYYVDLRRATLHYEASPL